jgi:hypothetical protein
MSNQEILRHFFGLRFRLLHAKVTRASTSQAPTPLNTELLIRQTDKLVESQ